MCILTYFEHLHVHVDVHVDVREYVNVHVLCTYSCSNTKSVKNIWKCANLRIQDLQANLEQDSKRVLLTYSKEKLDPRWLVQHIFYLGNFVLFWRKMANLANSHIFKYFSHPLSCSDCPILAVLSWQSCAGSPVFVWLVLLALFSLSRTGCPVLAVSCWLSCSSCPVLAVLFFWLSSPFFPALAALSQQSDPSSPGLVALLATPFWQSCPHSPFLAVLFFLSQSSLFCHNCHVLSVLFSLSSSFCSALAVSTCRPVPPESW